MVMPVHQRRRVAPHMRLARNDMAKNKVSIEERLIRSLGQAVAIAKEELAPARAYDLPLTAREAIVPAAPAYDSTDVIAIRSKLKLSQALFAQALNVSPGTVRSWEQGDKPPQGPSRRLLEIAARSPETLLVSVVVKRPAPPRAVNTRKASIKRGSASRGAAGSRGGTSQRKRRH